MRALAVLLLLGLVAVPGGHRVGRAGVTIVLPVGWITRAPMDGNVTNPRTRIVAASRPMQLGRRGCATQVAQYTLAPDAVEIVVVEWLPPLAGHVPPRPRRFTQRNLRVRANTIECFDGLGGSIEFIAHGRTLGVYLLAGRSASAAQIDRARRVADTLRIEQRR